MKIKNSLVVVAGSVLLLASAGQSWAQFQPVGDDGIAASPKFREFLNRRNAVSPAMGGAEYFAQGVEVGGIATSPKARELANTENAAVTAPKSMTGTVGYTATGADGISTSPKHREILDQQQQQQRLIEIAPLK